MHGTPHVMSSAKSVHTRQLSLPAGIAFVGDSDATLVTETGLARFRVEIQQLDVVNVSARGRPKQSLSTELVISARNVQLAPETLASFE